MSAAVNLPVKLARELVWTSVGKSVDGWTKVATDEGDSGRWTQHIRLIIQRDDDGQLFASWYELGLTEYQDNLLWECEDEATFEPVERRIRKVEVVEYVALADQAEAATDGEGK